MGRDEKKYKGRKGVGRDEGNKGSEGMVRLWERDGKELERMRGM